jgi:hypothetical protein
MEATEIFEQNQALVLAAKDKEGIEPWSDEYKKDPETFAKLLKAEAKIQRVMLQFFKDQSDRAPQYVNWNFYRTTLERLKRVQADTTDDFQVEVIVQDLPDSEDGLVMQALYNPLATAVIAGVQAGEAIYLIPLDEVATSKAIDQAAKRQIAQLVGKKIDQSGNIVDNPSAKYRINDVTRQKIRDSIRLSLSLGEDQEAATTRLRDVIRNPRRAELVAQTESVNGYQGGMFNYANTTGAVGKEWQSLLGACLLCEGNTAAGIIGINDTFPSGHKTPSAHPRDRCGLRYVFAEELAL